MEADEFGLEYFEMAKSIMLNPKQNLTPDRDLNAIDFSIAVLEAGDLALLETDSKDVHESIFDALTTYWKNIPRISRITSK